MRFFKTYSDTIPIAVTFVFPVVVCVPSEAADANSIFVNKQIFSGARQGFGFFIVLSEDDLMASLCESLSRLEVLLLQFFFVPNVILKKRIQNVPPTQYVHFSIKNKHSATWKYAGRRENGFLSASDIFSSDILNEIC